MRPSGGPYYVIVGTGFSAVLNHLLLKRTKEGSERLGDLEVVHIGLVDPWSEYAIERMGQWPNLLALPGFSNQLAEEPVREFLRSEAFAGATEQELRILTSAENIVRGRVTDFERVSSGFRIKYVDESGAPSELMAAKVDFCTGLGPARKLSWTIVDPVLQPEYLDETSPRSRRLMTAADYLRSKDLVSAERAICVYGDGGVKGVLWVHREEFKSETMPQSRRNDGLLAQFDRGEDGGKTLRNIWPAQPELRLAWGYEIAAVRPREGERVEVAFQPVRDRARGHVDHTGCDRGPLGLENFDQVVVSIGSEYDARLWGRLASMAREPIVSPGDELLVGCGDHRERERSRLRILGPAIVQFRKSMPDEYTRNLDDYLVTLAGQAEGGLITAHGSLVAKANGGFQDDECNRNIQTVSEEDLRRLGVDDEAARELLLERRSRVEPFTRINTVFEDYGLQLGYDRRL
jgi:hypothetical protein